MAGNSTTIELSRYVLVSLQEISTVCSVLIILLYFAAGVKC
jgi:hypothetical protein